MQESSTLGQRIQEGRKAAGLSQEALGQQLNVSRQAVSKWESDTAVPELNNLIAMSRIFGIPVGQLLGVEPTSHDKAAASSAEPLSEAQLSAVEAIVARYVSQVQAHQSSHQAGRKKLASAALLLMVIGVAGWFFSNQMKQIDQRFWQMQQQVNGIQNSVSTQVDSLTQQFATILDDSSNPVASSKVLLTDFDSSAKTVTLQLMAAPKEWTQTTTAAFTVTLSDGRQFTADADAQNGTFIAQRMVVPMDEAIALSITLTDGESHRSGTLETRYDCTPGNFLLEVYGGISMSWRSNSNKVRVSDLSVDINIPYASYPLKLFPVSAEMCLYRDHETQPEVVIPISEVKNEFSESGLVSIYQPLKEPQEYEIPDGGTATLVIRVTDNFGQIVYAEATRISNHNNELESDYLTVEWQPGM